MLQLKKLTVKNPLNVHELTINADIDKLDSTALENQEIKELTLITHAPSTKLILPELNDDKIKKVINKPSIGCLKKKMCNIYLEGNILISDLSILSRYYYDSIHIDKIDVPMLQNLYVVFYDKNVEYKMEKVEPLKEWCTRTFWYGLYLGNVNCPVYVLNDKEEELRQYLYYPKSKESTEKPVKKPKKKSLPNLNIHEYEKVDYNDYLDHNDYNDDSDEYNPNESDDSQSSEFYYEEQSDE